LALAIGREVGLSEEDLLILELSALLHDLGMIAMPESLLEKPGPLTEAEYRTIQTHTVKSAEMIVGIALLGRAIPSILHHHERYDGTGYPNGLAGTDIPFFSRIVAIADAFVAMTRDRPYRPRLTDEEAVAEILAGAGSQFDPNVVAAFERIYTAGAVASQ
jgi:HD-GYP domain-containing protein (c-di-GMP phosphodiesterase class II)